MACNGKNLLLLIKNDTAFFTEQDNPNVILGKMLFFDPKLSKSSQVSCSLCHNPEMERRVALGSDHLLGNRNSISLYNIAKRKSFFWDGRAKTLEEQAAGPLGAHHEMAMDVEDSSCKNTRYKKIPRTFQKSVWYQ